MKGCAGRVPGARPHPLSTPQFPEHPPPPKPHHNTKSPNTYPPSCQAEAEVAWVGDHRPRVTP